MKTELERIRELVREFMQKHLPITMQSKVYEDSLVMEALRMRNDEENPMSMDHFEERMKDLMNL